MMQEKLPE